MKAWSGFQWPDGDKDCAQAITFEAMMYMGKFLSHVPGRNAAVQAGGNVGVYPFGLARAGFRTVHTFEPEWENFRCLCANIDLQGMNGIVRPYKAALGEATGTCGLVQNIDDNTGTFRVSGAGTIPVQTIDDLDLSECDLIWLDVEGYEVKALKGASATIDRHQPVVIIEETGLADDDNQTGSAIEWLFRRGYRPATKHGKDHLFVPSQKDK